MIFANIYDLVGVRIIVDTIQRLLCGARRRARAVGARVPGRFKDYIAMPKLNMYQLRRTRRWWCRRHSRVEIQIRTWDMHRRAEFGIARALEVQGERAGRPRPESRPGQVRSQARFRRQPGAVRGRQPQMDPAARRLDQRDPGLERVPGLARGGSWARPRSTCSRRRARSSRCRLNATPVDFAYAVHGRKSGRRYDSGRARQRPSGAARHHAG